MGRGEVHLTIDLDAPLELVFERITDHEALADWPGVSSSRLVREGSPRNGLGAVRRVTAMGLPLHEEVIQFEPPRRMDYKIVKGLPVDHRGTITLSASGAGTTLEWKITMSSRVPLLAQATTRALKLGLGRGLRYFKKDTEARAKGSRP
jgi:uncharacterized protein YndB with AHSA1/START domain